MTASHARGILVVDMVALTYQATYTREDRSEERLQTQRFERRAAQMIKNYPQPSSSVAGNRHLSLEDFEEAGIRVAERRYGAQEAIFAPGDPDEHLYFVLSGTVRLYKLYGGYKEATVTLLKDDELFGELSLQEGSGQTFFAQAMSYVRVAVIRKRMLVEVLKRDPELAVKLFFSLSERLEQSEEVIDRLLDREVSARLSKLLQNLSDRFGEANGSATVLDIRLTHQDLANMIASTREAVSKVMSEYQRDGLLEVRDRKIALSPPIAGNALGGSPYIPGVTDVYGRVTPDVRVA
jgi:CRP/FNR family transcriptional regulator, global nitrogen regulator